MGMNLYEAAVDFFYSSAVLWKAVKILKIRYQETDSTASEKSKMKKEEMIIKLRFLVQERYKNAIPFWLRVR
jgi:hypothetical protein